jgi:5'-3' exoribonuclease 2
MAAQALAGSNHDVVANRRAIRLANMSAAEMLKAELSGSPPKASALPQKQSNELDLSLPLKPLGTLSVNSPPPVTAAATAIFASPSPSVAASVEATSMSVEDGMDHEIPGLPRVPFAIPSPPATEGADEDVAAEPRADDMPNSPLEDVAVREAVDSLLASIDTSGDDRGPVEEEVVKPVAGVKRKLDDMEEDVEVGASDEDEPPPVISALAMTVNPDGTVEQEDQVKLVDISHL